LSGGGPVRIEEVTEKLALLEGRWSKKEVGNTGLLV
jgi:hypothetical protein